MVYGRVCGPRGYTASRSLRYLRELQYHAHSKSRSLMIQQTWGQAPQLPSCSNACNECTQQQQAGLNFGQVSLGATSFGGLNFGGCAIGSILGLHKRDFVPRGSSKRTFDLGAFLHAGVGVSAGAGVGVGAGVNVGAGGGDSGGVSTDLAAYLDMFY